MTLITILLMAMITFTTRYLLVHPRLPVNLGPKSIRFLSFSAPAVLTAIWVPIILVHDGQLNAGLSNPYLPSAALAVITARKTNNIYLTLVLSMAVFVMIKIVIST